MSGKEKRSGHCAPSTQMFREREVEEERTKQAEKKVAAARYEENRKQTKRVTVQSQVKKVLPRDCAKDRINMTDGHPCL